MTIGSRSQPDPETGEPLPALKLTNRSRGIDPAGPTVSIEVRML